MATKKQIKNRAAAIHWVGMIVCALGILFSFAVQYEDFIWVVLLLLILFFLFLYLPGEISHGMIMKVNSETPVKANRMTEKDAEDFHRHIHKNHRRNVKTNN